MGRANSRKNQEATRYNSLGHFNYICNGVHLGYPVHIANNSYERLMTFVEFIYFLLPIIVAITSIIFFAGSMYYMFSGDKKVYKVRGEYLMALAIVVAAIVLVVLLLVRSVV